MILKNDFADTIPLDGDWDFALGEGGAWGSVSVPGCWEAHGHDLFVDGPARYRRVVEIPADWDSGRIELCFEAVSYACQVFCNGVLVGSHEGMWTPFAIDLGTAARPGERNEIELVIYKPGRRYPTRACLAGFLPDVATTFGGPWQPVTLRRLEVGLRDLRVEARYADGTVRVRAEAERFNVAPVLTEWRVTVEREGESLTMLEIPAGDGRLDAILSPRGITHWSPEHPTLYTVEVTLLSGERPVARARRRVGFRRLSAQGDQLLLNDQPIQVRGVLSWGWDPAAIAPRMTVEAARSEMRRARAMGFNLIKLCLFVPEPSYFDAADEEGMLLWQELPMWLPEVTPALRERAPREYDEITARVAPHPSVVLYSLGCELNQSVDGALLQRLNRVVRERAGEVLLCDNSGSGESYGGLDFDFSDFTDYHPYYDLHYFTPLLDAWRRDWQTERPWIFGEFNDSDSFRDQDEIAPGERPWWLTLRNPVTSWRPEARAAVEWPERMRQADTGFSYPELVNISHRQSFLIRKYTLEALRLRRGMGGYIVTGLRDTPISTSGVWDDLLRPKWPEEEFRAFNGEAVLCLDVGRRRRWQHGGDRPDPLDPFCWWAGSPVRWDVILHSAQTGLAPGARLVWALTRLEGGRVPGGSAEVQAETRAGVPCPVGVIHWQAPALAHPQGYRLSVSLDGSVSTRNEWMIWVYPRPGKLPADLDVYDPTGILADFGDRLRPVPRLGPAALPDPARPLVATALPAGASLDGGLWDYLSAGGRVLLLQQGEAPLPARRCPFWREAIKPPVPHPVWERFPHEGYTGMPFFGVASDVAFDTPVLRAALPAGARFRPILRRLDAREFHIADYLFEVRLGRGLLLGCALRLQGGAGAQPSGWNRNVAGAALFEALLHSLTREDSPDATL